MDGEGIMHLWRYLQFLESRPTLLVHHLGDRRDLRVSTRVKGGPSEAPRVLWLCVVIQNSMQDTRIMRFYSSGLFFFFPRDVEALDFWSLKVCV